MQIFAAIRAIGALHVARNRAVRQRHAVMALHHNGLRTVGREKGVGHRHLRRAVYGRRSGAMGHVAPALGGQSAASPVAADGCRRIPLRLHIHIPGRHLSASCHMDATGMIPGGAHGAVRHGNGGALAIADHRVAAGRGGGHAHRCKRRPRAVRSQKPCVLTIKVAVFGARRIPFRFLNQNPGQPHLRHVRHAKGVFIVLHRSETAAADRRIRFQRRRGRALLNRARFSGRIVRLLRRRSVRRFAVPAGPFRRPLALRMRAFFGRLGGQSAGYLPRLREVLPSRRLNAVRHGRRTCQQQGRKQGRRP